MKARIWGCRGSLATPGATTVRYGGNTTCLEVRSSADAVVVFDAGTGIRELGRVLARESLHDIDLLLTHLHLDHIEGLGFFALLFDPECKIRIYGPRPTNGTLAEKIAAYLSPPYFPVPFAEINATISFEEIESDRWHINGLRISSAPVCHPGATLAYRVEENDASLAFVPDNEPGLDAQSGLAVAGGADVLLHDAQYTDEEYATRVGWGHTSLGHLANYLRDASPGRAVMIHHDPSHADDQLERMLDTARASSGHTDLCLGHEGLEIDCA
ncbi:MAG TPA: MBL fold metallo-hydrolase [Gaiellaceae bacterium]|nr:MBL fold metallo-hydrolase [Gaiellaceae bacterium]